MCLMSSNYLKTYKVCQVHKTHSKVYAKLNKKSTFKNGYEISLIRQVLLTKVKFLEILLNVTI